MDAQRTGSDLIRSDHRRSGLSTLVGRDVQENDDSMRPSPGASRLGNEVGIVGWFRSVPVALGLLLRGRVTLRTGRLGQPLTMSDGRTYVPFRETVKEARLWNSETAPAVLQPRFHLRVLGPRRQRLHAMFRGVCIVTAPFFIGLPGFRSKLWMVDPHTGDFAGLYEWDSADGARAYAEGLGRVLRVLSVRGSVTYEVVANTTVVEYLDRFAANTAGARSPRSPV
jgi:hypothetical protein